MTRNTKGIIGFLILSILLGPVIWLFMAGREIYQWKKYKLPYFEWDDIYRYTLTIFFGSIVGYVIKTGILELVK